jgi:hypothetical protein
MKGINYCASAKSSARSISPIGDSFFPCTPGLSGERTERRAARLGPRRRPPRRHARHAGGRRSSAPRRRVGVGVVSIGYSLPPADPLLEAIERDPGGRLPAREQVEAEIAASGLRVRFPVASLQVVTAFDWAAEHAAELGGLDGHIGLSGASAGGNLTAGAALGRTSTSTTPRRGRWPSPRAAWWHSPTNSTLISRSWRISTRFNAWTSQRRLSEWESILTSSQRWTRSAPRSTTGSLTSSWRSALP